MKRINAYHFTLVLFIILIFFLGKYCLVIFLRNKVIENGRAYESLIISAEKLKDIWMNGDIKGEWSEKKLSCSAFHKNELGADDNYLKCNPDYITCLWQVKAKEKKPFFIVENNEEIEKIFLKKDFWIRNINGDNEFRVYTILKKSDLSLVKNDSVSYLFRLVTERGVGFDIVLPSDCSEELLPEGIYGYSEFNDKNPYLDWRWDNFGRTIAVDKYLVSNRDIIEWIEYEKDDEKQTVEDIKRRIDWSEKNRSLPADYLSLGEMKKYCAFRGKQLLQAHIMDASTFYPLSSDELKNEIIIRSPYPWVNNEKKSFLYRIHQEEENKDLFHMNKKRCGMIYTKECMKILPYEGFDTKSYSWIGLHQILGGYLEAFYNPLFVKNNLKTSSFYFKSRSKVHRLGKRSHWSGRDMSVKSIQWRGLYQDDYDELSSENSFKIGFRCMREKYHGK
jgi:GTP cyclohydrolase II